MIVVVDRSVSRRRIPKNWPCHILRFETMTPYLASPSKMAMRPTSHIHTDPIPSLIFYKKWIFFGRDIR